MKTKVCRGPCGRRLSASRFYPHPETADGRTNKCKNCIRAEQRKRDRARRRRLLKGVLSPVPPIPAPDRSTAAQEELLRFAFEKLQARSTTCIKQVAQILINLEGIF